MRWDVGDVGLGGFINLNTVSNNLLDIKGLYLDGLESRGLARIYPWPWEIVIKSAHVHRTSSCVNI